MQINNFNDMYVAELQELFSMEGQLADAFERFGDWKIVHQRFSRWAKSGVFERIFKLLASDHDNEYMMIDATIVRAHQHSAGARKKTASKRSDDPAAD
jgi:transposase